SGFVCNVHSVTEQLGDQRRVRSLAAPCACAGELQQGLLELATLNSILFELGHDLFLNRQRLSRGEDLRLAQLPLQTLQPEGRVALHAGAYICPGAASGTIQSRNSDRELVSGHTGHTLHLHIRRSLGSLVGSHGNRTDYSMRTNVGTEVTLDTVVRIPYGNI